MVAVADARAVALADDHLPRPLLLIARGDGRPAVGTQERPLLARRLLHEMLLARAAAPVAARRHHPPLDDARQICTIRASAARAVDFCCAPWHDALVAKIIGEVLGEPQLDRIWRVLLARGASTEHKNKSSKNALVIASDNEHFEVAALLILARLDRSGGARASARRTA